MVVEAVEHHIEEGMSPKDATFKAMEEISGPVVGIALVLSAVFIPTAFIPGITGRLYQQFAVTIAISVILSAFNALSLSPALSALLLRPRQKSSGLLQRFFDWFNRVFARVTDRYVSIAGALIRKTAIAFVLLIVCAGLAGFFGSKVPSSFLPDEDQGYMFMNLQLPSASSLQRTEATAREIEQALAKTPGVKSTASVIGFSLLSLTRSSYSAFFFVTLEEWKDRKKREEQYQFIRQSINREADGTSGRHCVFIFSASDSWSGDLRWIHVCAGGQSRGRTCISGRKHEQISCSSSQETRTRLGEYNVSTQCPTAVHRRWTGIRL